MGCLQGRQSQLSKNLVHAMQPNLKKAGEIEEGSQQQEPDHHGIADWTRSFCSCGILEFNLKY